MSISSEENLKKVQASRPEEWRQGQEIGAMVANEYELDIPGIVSDSDIEKVITRMILDRHSDPIKDPVEMSRYERQDPEGVRARVLGSFEGILETLYRKGTNPEMLTESAQRFKNAIDKKFDEGSSLDAIKHKLVKSINYRSYEEEIDLEPTSDPQIIKSMDSNHLSVVRPTAEAVQKWSLPDGYSYSLTIRGQVTRGRTERGSGDFEWHYKYRQITTFSIHDGRLVVKRHEEGPIDHPDGRRAYRSQAGFEGIESLVAENRAEQQTFVQQLGGSGVEVTDPELVEQVIILIKDAEVKPQP